jgi:hypothetical protein
MTERTARMYILGLRPQRREVSPEMSVPMNFPMKGVETMTDWSVEVKAYCPLEFTEPKSSRKATLSVQESGEGVTWNDLNSTKGTDIVSKCECCNGHKEAYTRSTHCPSNVIPMKTILRDS